jgi:hypothetical protein
MIELQTCDGKVAKLKKRKYLEYDKVQSVENTELHRKCWAIPYDNNGLKLRNTFLRVIEKERKIR